MNRLRIWSVSIALTYVVFYLAFMHALSYEHPDERNDEIISYLRGPVLASNQLAFLTTAEQAHMTDVKRLFSGAFLLALLCGGILIGVFVALWKKWIAQLFVAHIFWRSGWMTLLTCGSIGLLTLGSFTRFWTAFHVLFFPQGNWIFPRDSTLIQLYPHIFFQSFFLSWFAWMTVYGAVAIALAVCIRHIHYHERLFKGKLHKHKKATKR